MDLQTGSLSSTIRVLLAECRPLQSQLLAAALREQGFQVSTCAAEVEEVLQILQNEVPDVLLMRAVTSSVREPFPLRTIHLAFPQVPKVVLLDSEARDLVVNAFRSGAHGIFSVAASPFPALCECIAKVYGGGVWASSRQLGYLLDSVCQVRGVQVLTARGEKLLTSREEQVVALVADGLSNRDVASELGLSEHTVKKYLFRIFDKLGISNRVELVLYAVHHGAPEPSEWAATA